KKSPNYITTVTGFTGPDINQLVKHLEFAQHLDEQELSAWMAFIEVKDKFLGNVRAENCKELVEHMLICFKDIGCNCTYKLHLLHAHLDRFPPNCGAQGEQQCEKAHQEIKHVEDHFRSHKRGPAVVSEFTFNQDGCGTK